MIGLLKSIAAKARGRSGSWPALRDKHLKDNPWCEACGRVKRLTVHHVIPVHVDPSLELDEKNLITLCGVCHLVFGHFFSWRRFNKNVVSDVKVFRQKVGER